ncbi:hypothetical protein DSUL_20126 [Desulfovibrionales bacterium]
MLYNGCKQEFGPNVFSFIWTIFGQISPGKAGNEHFSRLMGPVRNGVDLSKVGRGHRTRDGGIFCRSIS